MMLSNNPFNNIIAYSKKRPDNQGGIVIDLKCNGFSLGANNFIEIYWFFPGYTSKEELAIISLPDIIKTF